MLDPRNMPLSELIPIVKVLTKLAHNCVFLFSDISQDEYNEDSAVVKSLEFLNCLQLPMRINEGSEVFTVDDLIRNRWQ